MSKDKEEKRLTPTEEKKKRDKEIFASYADLLNFSQDIVSTVAPTTQRRRKYNRQQIRQFLSDPFRNYSELQEVSQYLKATSGNYFRIVEYLSDLLTLDYYIYPNGKSEIDNHDKVLKGYKNAAVSLEKMKIKFNFRWILRRLIENGEVYIYEIEDRNGIVYKEIPPNFCRISMSDNNVFRYEINVDKITEDIREAFPQEIQNATGDSDGWYQVSDSGFAFNAMGSYSHGFPVLCMMFDDIMGLDETKDLTEGKNKLDAIKLIHQKIPLSPQNEPIFDEFVSRIYHNATKRNLPDGVAITTNPFQVTSVPFDKNITRDLDTIERAERNIWAAAGISKMVFDNDGTSGEALKRSIIADETLMFPKLKDFSNYINSKIEKTRFNLVFLDTSYYNIDDKIRSHKELLAYGASRTHLLALQGYEPIQTLNLFKFEQEILGIDEYLIPKETSHTMSSDGERGAPTQEEKGEEVKDNTDISRDDQ